MRSFKSNENIHKKEGGSYYVVSAIKASSVTPKFMVPIALLEKFGSYTFITGIEISHMTGHSSKPNKLRNVNPVRGSTGNVTIQKWKIYYIKIEVIALIIPV